MGATAILEVCLPAEIILVPLFMEPLAMIAWPQWGSSWIPQRVPFLCRLAQRFTGVDSASARVANRGAFVGWQHAGGRADHATGSAGAQAGVWRRWLGDSHHVYEAGGGRCAAHRADDGGVCLASPSVTAPERAFLLVQHTIDIRVQPSCTWSRRWMMRSILRR